MNGYAIDKEPKMNLQQSLGGAISDMSGLADYAKMQAQKQAAMGAVQPSVIVRLERIEDAIRQLQQTLLGRPTL